MQTSKLRNTLFSRGLIGLIFLILFGCLTVEVYAQEEEPSIEEEAESSDIPEPLITFEYQKVNANVRWLRAIVKIKEGRNFLPVSGVPLVFYIVDEEVPALIGNAITDIKGVALLVLPAGDEKVFRPIGENNYSVVLTASDTLAGAEEVIVVSDVLLEMELVDDGETRSIVVSLNEVGPDGDLVPLPDEEVYIGIQRMYGILPVGEEAETTDEEGKITIEFPENIPGDSLGSLILIAALKEHERFGNVEVRQRIQWGIPLSPVATTRVRELWSSRLNAPWYLFITVNGILAAVWGVIAYILYQLFSIRRLSSSVRA